MYEDPDTKGGLVNASVPSGVGVFSVLSLTLVICVGVAAVTRVPLVATGFQAGATLGAYTLTATTTE